MTQRNNLIGGAILALAVVLFLAACTGNISSSTSHTVTLHASGGSAMYVTYGVGDKNSQNTSVASPWQVGYKVTGDLPLVTMVVQNGGGGSSAVSCSVTEDGRVVSSNTSYGAYAVVQCSA